MASILASEFDFREPDFGSPGKEGNTPQSYSGLTPLINLMVLMAATLGAKLAAHQVNQRLRPLNCLGHAFLGAALAWNR